MKLVLVGCGKMGSAMLQGWLAQGIKAQDIRIVEHSAEQAKNLTETYKVTTHAAIEEIDAGFAPDVVILAVKPQVMDAATTAAKRFLNSATFLSIAAGKTIASFEAILGSDAAIVRVMPNTPAAVGRGISVGVANSNVTSQTKDACANLMQAVGEFAWADDEGLIDAVTGVSGSGPAYVFYMTECMTQAGIAAGLPAALAEQLARATVAGAGELMRQSGTDAGVLRQNVTSPNGTTAAALEVLMANDGLEPLMTKAILAATNRSKELAG